MIQGEHFSTVTVHTTPPIELPVKRQQIEMDREWVPYVQATLTCPLSDPGILLLDPLAGAYIWATIAVRRLMGRTDRLDDLTRLYRPSTLGEITSAFPTLAALTASLYHDYTIPGGPLRVQQRDFKMMVRAAPVNYLAAEVTFELGGGEARLLEDVNTGAPFTPLPGQGVRAKIDWVLARNGFPPVVNNYLVIDSEFTDQQSVWDTGETAWEYITKLFRVPAGFAQRQLWCTEKGEWWVGYDRPANNNGTAAPKTHRNIYSYGPDRTIKNAVEQRSRDTAFNAVVLIYRDVDGTVSYDSATTPGEPVNAFVERRDGRAAARPGAASSMLSNMRDRGRALEVLAVADYAWTPGDFARFHRPPALYPQGGDDGIVGADVVAVRWNHPEDEMSLRLRRVIN